MYILGIYYGHNSTACLLKDGQIIAAASEERFNRIKNYKGFPKNALAHVLSEEKIDSSKLDFVTLSFTYMAPIHSVSQTENSSLINLFLVLTVPFQLIRNFWGKLTFRFPSWIKIGRIFYLLSIYTVGKYTRYQEINFIAKFLKIDKNKIKHFDHHLSHAASAYYASPFNQKKALVLTVDGEGDSFSASVNIFEDDKYTVLAKTPRESSLGMLYAWVTAFLGMKPNEHEYKVMGLAPYAKKEDVDKLYKRIEHIITVDDKNLRFKSPLNMSDALRFLDSELKHIRFDLIAGIFQKLLEEKITYWVEAAMKQTKITTLVLAGGVLMNVKVNQQIANLANIKELFIVPPPSDESSIIGSSYLAFKQALPKAKIPPIQEIYWGPNISKDELDEVIKKAKKSKFYKVTQLQNPEKQTAKLLANGEAVARCSGKMEFGPRSLGNRSILADPRNLDIVRVINEQVKNRDFWMPFAPSIIEERFNDYAVNSRKYKPYYMILAYDATEKGKKELRAAMHQYDFTIRPQMVKKEHNPMYYNIIKEFEKLTGVGAILNTSFNLHGFPIVKGAIDAFQTFENSGLKYLVLENYLLQKK